MDPTEYLRLYESSPYRRAKVSHIRQLIGTQLTGKLVLDFGAGGGYMALYCARQGAKIVVVEDDPNQLARAESVVSALAPGAQCEFFCDRSLPPDVRRRRFDLVIAKDVLEHVPGDADLVRQFASCQAPGGELLVSTQNKLSLNYLLEGLLYHRWWKGDVTWCGWDDSHVRFYTPSSLRALVVAAGYKPIAWRSTWVVPHNMLSWLTLLRSKRDLALLGKLDLWLGQRLPFNRIGWNLITLARRA